MNIIDCLLSASEKTGLSPDAVFAIGAWAWAIVFWVAEWLFHCLNVHFQKKKRP